MNGTTTLTLREVDFSYLCKQLIESGMMHGTNSIGIALGNLANTIRNRDKWLNSLVSGISPDIYYEIKNLVAILKKSGIHITYKTINRELRRGKIPYMRPSKKFYIKGRDFIEYLERKND